MSNNNPIFSNSFNIKEFFSSSKFKFVRYLLILALLGVFFMLIGDFNSGLSSNNQSKDYNNNHSESSLSFEEALENKLEKVLTKISGVGKVVVDITLESGSEYIYARNHQNSEQKTVENDGSNLVRNTEQFDKREEIVLTNQGGAQEPVVKREIKAKIRGVLVVAQGANNSNVKFRLIQAVKVGLGVESHKIIVLAQER